LQPLFPGFTPPIERPVPRWVRLTVTLGPEGRVLATQVDAMSLEGVSLLSRGFWPPPGQQGAADAIADVLRFGQELVMD